MGKSHFRRFTTAEWNSTAGRPPDSVAMHTFGNGDVLAHCAAPSTDWVARHGRRGTFNADRIREMPLQDRNRILEREIEQDSTTPSRRQRRRIRMGRPVPPGATLIAENIVPHLFLGEQSSEVA